MCRAMPCAQDTGGTDRFHTLNARAGHLPREDQRSNDAGEGGRGGTGLAGPGSPAAAASSHLWTDAANPARPLSPHGLGASLKPSTSEQGARSGSGQSRCSGVNPRYRLCVARASQVILRTSGVPDVKGERHTGDEKYDGRAEQGPSRGSLECHAERGRLRSRAVEARQRV